MRITPVLSSQLLTFSQSPLDLSYDVGVPRVNLVLFVPKSLQDSIGESDITLTTGTSADLMAATWGFPDNAVTQQLDTDLGGDVLFDSSDSDAPFVRSGAEWYALLNSDYLWVGPRGIAGYSVDMSAYSTQIQRVLGTYTASETVFNDLTESEFNQLSESEFNAAT